MNQDNDVNKEQVTTDIPQVETQVVVKTEPAPIAKPTQNVLAVTTPLDDAPFDPKTGLVPRTFAQLIRLAEIFSRSKMVPAHFQGKSDDCFVALQMAYRMELDPMTALQNIYVVSGKPGLSSQLIISLVNRSRKLVGPVQWRIAGKGETLEVTAFGTLRETGEEISFTVPWSMVKAEGWEKNPKYRSMPEVMMRYRSVAFLARFHFPEVIIGMQSAEEIEDTLAAEPAPAGSAIERMKAQALAAQ